MARDGLVSFAEHGDGGHDLTGRAVAALEGIAFEEGFLHGVEVVFSSNSFDRGDFVALMRYSER